MLRLHRLIFVSILLPVSMALPLQSIMAEELSTPQPALEPPPVTSESQSEEAPTVQAPMLSEPDNVTSRAVQPVSCDFSEAVDCSDPWWGQYVLPHHIYFHDKFAPACVRHDLCYRYG